MRIGTKLPTAAIPRTGLAIVACLLGTSWAIGSSAQAAGGSTSSVQQALGRSLSAAKAEGSVRITVEFYSGTNTGKVVQDAARQSGEQTVAIGTGRASVILVGRMAYISANSQGLSSYFGFPTTLVARLVGRWISIRPTDPAFQEVTGNVALDSALANVTPSGKLSTGKRLTVKHQSVRSIAGAAPGGGRLTLFVAANGRALPVEAIESSGSGTSSRGEIVTFTRWGERLHVPKPRSAVPISSLPQASSATG